MTQINVKYPKKFLLTVSTVKMEMNFSFFLKIYPKVRDNWHLIHWSSTFSTIFHTFNNNNDWVFIKQLVSEKTFVVCFKLIHISMISQQNSQSTCVKSRDWLKNSRKKFTCFHFVLWFFSFENYNIQTYFRSIP